MRIAATYDTDGTVFQHFGRTEQFKIYEIEDNKVVSSRVVGNGGLGHGALAGLLAENQVQGLICGGLGGGAQMALAQMGIKVYAGVTGSADDAVEALLKGTLDYADSATCDHHGEHHEGGCAHEAGECGHGCH